MNMAYLALHLGGHGREFDIVADVRGVGVFLKDRGDAIDDVLIAGEKSRVLGN
jgi:hypothetical protein